MTDPAHSLSLRVTHPVSLSLSNGVVITVDGGGHPVDIEVNTLKTSLLPPPEIVDIETVSIPSALDVPEALGLLRRLQRAGMLDAALRPVAGTARTEAALMAEAVAQRLERRGVRLTSPMALFGQWWGVANLRQYRYRAMGQQKTAAFIERLARALDDQDNTFTFSF